MYEKTECNRTWVSLDPESPTTPKRRPVASQWKKTRAATVTRTRASGEAKRWPLFELGGVFVGEGERVDEVLLVVVVVEVEAELLALEVVLLLSLLLLLVLLALLEVVLEAEVLVLERVAEVEPEVVVSVPVPTYGNSSL